MSDLVARLRSTDVATWTAPDILMRDAADRIEQLDRERDEALALLKEAQHYVGMVRSNDIAGDDPIFALLDRIDALLKGTK